MTDLTEPKLLKRDILILEGEETLTFLHNLLTQSIEDMADGEMRYTALLTPQGKILETMFLSWLNGRAIIDLPAGRGESFSMRLRLYKLRAKVSIRDAAQEMCIGLSKDTEHVPDEAIIVEQDPRLKALGQRWIAPAPLILPRLPEDQYKANLIANGIPDFDLGYGDAEAFPLDVNLDRLNGINHKKGCFIGQEVASRMFRKGEIRKRTWMVSGSGLEPEQTLVADGVTIGKVISVSSDQGLATIRLDRLLKVDRSKITTNDGPAVNLTEPDYLK